MLWDLKKMEEEKEPTKKIMDAQESPTEEDISDSNERENK